MNPVHHPVVPPSTAGSLEAEPHALVLADGLVVGGLAGLLTLASVQWAPWLVMEIVGFLTAPTLLGVSVIGPPGALAAPVAIVVGSMLLYAAYALVILVDHRIASHFEHEVVAAVAAGQEVLRNVDSVVVGNSLDRLPRGYQTQKRKLRHRLPSGGFDIRQFDAPLLIPMTAQEALLLEQPEMLVDGAVRGVAELSANLTVSR